jgi:hypothetical protein
MFHRLDMLFWWMDLSAKTYVFASGTVQVDIPSAGEGSISKAASTKNPVLIAWFSQVIADAVPESLSAHVGSPPSASSLIPRSNGARMQIGNAGVFGSR